jgi:signal transduction histidine kinase
VEDDGPGFPDDFIGQAFERFSRADAARGRGGAGLGLAIVAAIARGHGGSAHARNTDAGSDVWIDLPAQVRSRAVSGSTAHSPPNNSSASTPVTSVAAPE